MRVNSFHFSAFEPCGISIFSRHLAAELSMFGYDVAQTNLRLHSCGPCAPIWFLHYAPSSFASPKASFRLMRLIRVRPKSTKLCVILHGLFAYHEDRFLKDRRCPNQALHVELILKSADIICALSASVLSAMGSWPGSDDARGKIIRLDHPGLFSSPEKSLPNADPYAFLG